jgi:predicted  nucleic acid-binding Zn-ribbon protein
MSKNPSFPQTYFSSNTIQENSLNLKNRNNLPNKNPNNNIANKIFSSLNHTTSSRNFSGDKSFGKDNESIQEEMRAVNKQLAKKRKEYEYLKKEHEKLETENIIILNLLENLISECQEIEEPLEKRSKDINQEQLKTRILIYRLKNKLKIFEKDLTNKEELLNKLKRNDRALRMFELDDKIKDTKEKLSQVLKEQENFKNQINIITKETFKTNNKIKNLINQNNNLKNEKKDFINKINVLTKNNQNLDTKKNVLQEKVSNMQSTIEQTEKSIETKNKEIESLKEKEKEYNDLNIEKLKYEKEINSYLKNLLSLNDQINKKNRQIKEDEKLMISFENHIKALHERESEIKIEESKVEEQERKKKEKEEVLNAVKNINDMIINHKIIVFDNTKLKIEQIISFKLNVPNIF